MSRIAIAAAAAVLIPFAASAGEKPIRAEHLASVSTYKPIQGFSHTVGSRHFVGYFVTANNSCAVTVIDATVGRDRLLERRQKFNLAAAGRTEVKADQGKALAIGCSADANEIQVVALEPRIAESASQ